MGQKPYSHSITLNLETELLMAKIKRPGEDVSSFIRDAIKAYANSKSQEQIDLREMRDTLIKLNKNVDNLASYVVENTHFQEERDRDLKEKLNETFDWIEKKIGNKLDV